MIELIQMGVVSGHRTTMCIDDVVPEERKKLAKTVTKLLKEKHAIFIQRGRESFRIKGYDSKKNEWIEASTEKRVPAADKDEAAAVAQIAGG